MQCPKQDAVVLEVRSVLFVVARNAWNSAHAVQHRAENKEQMEVVTKAGSVKVPSAIPVVKGCFGVGAPLSGRLCLQAYPPDGESASSGRARKPPPKRVVSMHMPTSSMISHTRLR
jgi:hypothetical protein